MARRKEFKLDRDAYIAKLKQHHENEQQHLSTSPTVNIPSHIRNRPSPPRCSAKVKEEDTSLSTINNNDNNTKHQQPSSPTNYTNNKLQSQIIPGWYHSFEYFPLKTRPGLDLQNRMCQRFYLFRLLGVW